MTREQIIADALFEKLSSRGAILNGTDRRLIRQAFERHYRAVQLGVFDSIAASFSGKRKGGKL
jgi:hypothetical protein